MPEKQNPRESAVGDSRRESPCRNAVTCGCMKGALEEMRDSLAAGGDQDVRDLREKVETWLGKTQESLYT